MKEKSPYLLQHAHNPVDWYPWGTEAFEKAKKEDKPIFLSIGYSTCHWCHVMERESFEDEEVAKMMKEHFVSIKVDREERPDVDAIYMSVCQAMTGSGGWPLTVVMTPDQKPFFSGTYFSKHERFGRPGMMTILPQIARFWKTDREKAIQSANKITDAIRGAFQKESKGEALTVDTLKQTFLQIRGRFDDEHGGFSHAPKFPTPHNLTFLLRWWFRSKNPEALSMVEKTLEEMRKGGLFDHVGFGFHRYSTDARWLVPHFEKMLYDQAQIAIAALETYQATRKPIFARISREIFTYVLRDMTDAQGGFYSAEDADSEGEEGKFYVWSKEEILTVLGKEEGEWFCRTFQADEAGNFHDEAGGKRQAVNILHLNGWPEDSLTVRMEASREKLFQVREVRIHPYKDDKVLTDWNGLMIAALARGAQVLEEPAYAEAAKRAVSFVSKNLSRDGQLLHRYRLGEAGIAASLEDYAFFVWGLLEVYEATFDSSYLDQAKSLSQTMLDLFWDDDRGGFYLTSKNHEALIARPMEIYDGALPSGNSVAAMNLIRLARLTGDQKFEDKVSAMLKGFGGTVNQAPTAHTQFLQAVDFAVGPSREVVVAGDLASWDNREMVSAIRRQYSPRKVVMVKITPEQPMIDGKATAYVCENFSCKLPTTDIKEMLKLLEVEDQ